MERLMIYSQDGMGLGHLRGRGTLHVRCSPGNQRAVFSSWPIRRLSPSFPHWVVWTTSSFPPLSRREMSRGKAAHLPLNISETVNLRAKVIRQVFREFKPDAVLVDHMPVGALGVKLLLESSVQRKRHSKFFFLVCGMCWTPPR